jgi:hypothetical protein
MPEKPPNENRYKALAAKIFLDRFKPGTLEVPFERTDLEAAAKAIGINLPKNLGDVIYAIRYRIALPDSILATQPNGMEWIIEGTGRASYAFKLVPINRIIPNPALIAIKIPDATPEIISANALSDEQSLLAKLRYNRLIDVFLGISAHSLQSHLRTSVPKLGQIEIDEVYAGVDRQGRQYIIPVQAKGGSDQLSVVQTKQDLLCCQDKFPNLIPRSISAQFMSDGSISIFELTIGDGQVKIVEEKHYRLVPASEITATDLALYSRT